MGKGVEDSVTERVTWNRFYITLNQVSNQIASTYRRWVWRRLAFKGLRHPLPGAARMLALGFYGCLCCPKNKRCRHDFRQSPFKLDCDYISAVGHGTSFLGRIFVLSCPLPMLPNSLPNSFDITQLPLGGFLPLSVLTTSKAFNLVFRP